MDSSGNAVNSVKMAAFRVVKSLSYYRHQHFFLFCLVWVAILLFGMYTFTDISTIIPEYLDQGTEDNIRLYRDVYTQERWPEIEHNVSSPGEIPYFVHYFWCGSKVFRFEHYLSLLSIIRVLKPQKIVFHYHYLPTIDERWYHTWFQELKQSVPNLVLRYRSNPIACSSKLTLRTALAEIVEHGGIYVGETTLVTRVPREATFSDFHASSSRVPTSSSDVTQGVIFSKSGFPKSTIGRKIDRILDSPNSCYSVEDFDKAGEDKRASGSRINTPTSFTPDHEPVTKDCLVLWESLYPKDIWNSSTRFGELARWLFYGKRGPLQVHPDPPDAPLIPLVSHIVWLRTNNILKSNEFKFLHYLSVLSALHVAGFQRVYVHGEIMPYGKWWDRLHGQNVTFVKIEPPETIFQQSVEGPAHQSDVLRLNTLLRLGGVYHDRDVVWTSPIPRWLRQYQAVACPDWPRNGAWPEVLNLGVMMAKPGSEWLRHFLKTFLYYRDDKWAFNAIFMPYKAYEFHPDTLYLDRRLQAICFRGVCHPAWHDDYIRNIDDVSPVRPFDWREARSYHFTVPKPPPSMSSPDAIVEGNDVFSEIGRMVLEKGGQGDLLKR